MAQADNKTCMQDTRGANGQWVAGVKGPSQSKGGKATAAIMEFRKLFSYVAKKHVTEARMEKILLRLLDDIEGDDRRVALQAMKELFDRLLGKSKLEVEINDVSEEKTVSQEARDIWLEIGKRSLSN